MFNRVGVSSSCYLWYNMQLYKTLPLSTIPDKLSYA